MCLMLYFIDFTLDCEFDLIWLG